MSPIRPAGPSTRGRDLAAAIARRPRLLGAVILSSLLIERHYFLGVLAVAAGRRHLGARRCAAPGRRDRGAAAGAARRRPGDGLAGVAVRAARARASSFAATALAVLLWRMRAGAAHYVRDVTAGMFTAAYVPLFCSFAMLMTVAPDGVGRVLDVHDLRGGLRRRRLRGRRARGPAPDGPHDQPEEVVGGLRRLAGRRHARRRAHASCFAARRALVGGCAHRRAAGGQRHAGRPRSSRWSSATSASRTWARCCPATAG